MACELHRLHLISTHTPHARRDIRNNAALFSTRISTHTPHARRDDGKARKRKLTAEFQLTRLMRGVTYYKLLCRIHYLYFNSHASCEA